MNSINVYKVGKRTFANLLEAIDHAVKTKRNRVTDTRTGLTVWKK